MFDKFLVRLYDHVLIARARIQLSQFAEHGDNVTVGRFCDFIPSHIHCGHHVSIGANASFMESKAHIYIGNYIAFGPFVTISGGSHRTDLIGKHICLKKEAFS